MATWYVDPVNGSNSNNGTTQFLAVANFWKALTLSISAGDTIKLISRSTESPTSTNTATFTASGTLTNPIIVIGCDTSGNELADGSYYTIDGSSMSSSTDILTTAAQTNIRFRHVKLTNSKRYAVTCSGGVNIANTIQFVSCYFNNPTTAAFAIASGSGDIAYYLLNCTCNGSTSSGSQTLSIGGINRQDISLVGCKVTGWNTCFGSNCGNGMSDYENTIFANNGTIWTASLYINTQRFDSCVFYNNTSCINFSDRSSTSVLFGRVISCVFYNNTTAMSGYDNTIRMIVSDYNLFYGNTTDLSGTGLAYGPHDIHGSNPLFNNASGLDFSLKSGSPAIGAGPCGVNIAGLTQAASSGGVLTAAGGWNGGFTG